MSTIDKKTYKADVENLIQRYIVNLEKHAGAKKKLLNEKEAIKLLFDGGKYPYEEPLDDSKYNKEMGQLQIELVKAQSWLQKSGQKALLLFEGRDAAGKGGTIQRFMLNLNPRYARISALTVPTEYEKGQWYFQRYIKNLPSAGEIVFSDRSWYNRAGVEKVMGYCTQEQYDEFINQVVPFEKMIADSGILLVKYWLTIDQVEQLRRFRKRQTSEVRCWKLSENDIASIDKWDDYSKALRKIFKKTNHDAAPWYVVHADDKNRGRLECIRHFLNLVDYPDKNEKLLNKVDTNIIIPAAEEEIK